MVALCRLATKLTLIVRNDRLFPLTGKDNLCKALLPVGNEPMISAVLGWVEQAGILGAFGRGGGASIWTDELTSVFSYHFLCLDSTSSIITSLPRPRQPR